MAGIGVKYPMVARYNNTDGVENYSDGKIMGRAISIDLSVETADAELYTDDGLSESVREFAGGTLTVAVAEIEDEMQAIMYGHAYKAAIEGETPEPAELICKINDTSAATGFGFVAPVIRYNVRKYRGIFFTHVVFSTPGFSYKTKEKTLTFTTASTVGTLLSNIKGEWKREATFVTEKEAVDWLKNKLNITTT